MLRSIRIENYRSFESMEVKNLKKLNIITGKNGSGKSSFLEAIFLICGAANAGLSMSISGFRGENRIHPESDYLFSSIFPNLDVKSKVTIEASSMPVKTHQERSVRKLMITPLLRPDILPGRSSTNTRISGVNFRFNGPSGNQTSEVRLNTQMSSNVNPGLPLQQPPIFVDVQPQPDLINARFVSPYVRELMEQEADLISSATKAKQVGRIVEALQLIEPRIKSILPITEYGHSSVWVDLDGPVMMPISSLGSGFYNLLNIVLAIYEGSSGVVIIDEIEDGLHYTVLPKLSRLLIEASHKYSAQIFVSTHSAEFLHILIREAEKLEFNDMSIIRLSKDEPQRSIVFDNNDIAVADEFDAELR